MLSSHWPELSHWQTYQWLWLHCAFVFQQPPNIMVLMMFLCQTSIIGLCDEPVSGHSSELAHYLGVQALSFQSMPRFYLSVVQSSHNLKQLSVSCLTIVKKGKPCVERIVDNAPSVA